MKRVNGKSMKRVVMAVAVPAGLLLGAGTAGAQWGGQQSQRYPQQQGRYPGQQQQQSRYGSQQQLFVWQGRVDREIRIQMNGGRASVIQIGNNERGNGRVRTLNAVPHQDGVVTVQQLDGRGKVDIVQQPNRGNGYTAIFRLRDPQSGAATYRVAGYWQPTGNYGVNRDDARRGRGRGNRGNNGNGNGNGHYDNGGWGHDRQ